MNPNDIVTYDEKYEFWGLLAQFIINEIKTSDYVPTEGAFTRNAKSLENEEPLIINRS